MANPQDFPPFGVTICGIPEIEEHSAAGITHILSIHDPDLADPPEFASFPPHRRLSLHFHDIIEAQPRLVAPTRENVERLLEFGREVAAPHGHLLIHCHAGVSRSTAAAALILAQAAPERPASEVFEAIVRIRPRAWPNLRMLEFGDELLGRGGDIVAAVTRVYRRLLERQPELEEAMIVGGRLREVLSALA